MEFIQTNDADIIAPLRVALYEQLQGPIDGMWEALYIANAQDYLIEKEGQTIGYCCIDAQKSLLQIFLDNAHRALMDSSIEALIASGLIASAKLSSIEPAAFNAALGHSKAIKKNTLCYAFSKHPLVEAKRLELHPVSTDYADGIRAFFKSQIGFEDNFGYTDNLIARKELFKIENHKSLIATGECRISDAQPGIADLGVVVSTESRRHGIATQILLQLANASLRDGHTPICSTTVDNIGAQKAIEKAGFYCAHIIFDIVFS